MSIFVRLFLVYGLALTLGGALLLRDVQQQIRPGMKEVLEDTLADNAQALAAALAPALEHGDIQNPAWQAQLRARLARPQDIHIHQHHKTANRQQLIITDSAGIVLFHSEAAETGKDYSRWNDILRTLRGEYGARSTQNTMYIAAPVHATDGRLLGVVSLGKPNTTCAKAACFTSAQPSPSSPCSPCGYGAASIASAVTPPRTRPSRPRRASTSPPS